MEQELKLEVEQFYRELDSVRYYWMQIKRIKLKLEEVAVKLYEAGAIDYSKEKIGHGSPSRNYHLSLMMKEERLIKSAGKWVEKIKHCELILSSCSKETQKALIEKYLLGKSWESVAKMLYMQRAPLQRKIDSELGEILKGAIAP